MTIYPKDVKVSELHQQMLTAIAPRPIAFASTVDKDGNDIEDKDLTEEQQKERKTKSRITSFILQEHERRILECVYDYLTLQQAIPDDNAVLCFDGIMILKRFYKDEFLVEMKQYVLEKTGFDVDFVQKEMNEGFRHLLEDQQPVEIGRAHV